MRGARGAAAHRAGKAGGKADGTKKKKSAGLFVSTVDKNGGLELPAEPLDFLGQGETLQRRWKRFMQSAMVIYGVLCLSTIKNPEPLVGLQTTPFDVFSAVKSPACLYTACIHVYALTRVCTHTYTHATRMRACMPYASQRCI